MLILANLHGIPIINGCAYHPQTQGSVEKANGIFKERLFVCQKEASCPVTDWIRFLPSIALCVNTTRPSSLLAYVTLFEVWFGRKPHFLHARRLNSNNKPCDIDRNELVFAEGEIDTGASAGGYSDTEDGEEDDTELEECILTAIELQVCKNNVIVA